MAENFIFLSSDGAKRGVPQKHTYSFRRNLTRLCFLFFLLAKMTRRQNNLKRYIYLYYIYGNTINGLYVGRICMKGTSC